MNAQERLEALQHARRGDNDALGSLLQSYQPYLRVIVHALGDRRVQARLDDSDLIQDALVEAHRSFGAFHGSTLAELTVWLRTIVVRTVGRTLRSIAAGKRDPAHEQPVDDLAGVAGTTSSPSAKVIRHEEALQMAEALARLPDDMQQVLLGRHVDGLAHADLAKRLGRSEAAVRMLYLRALRSLREQFGSKEE